MPAWNDRQLPHPLLAPWTDDYGERTFGAIVPHAVEGNGRNISLTIKYQLNSDALHKLISKKDAQYAAVVTCSRTSLRTTLTASQDDDVQVLEAGDYADELILAPYVLTMRELHGFTTDEFADEFRRFKPEGFYLPSGAILAVGEQTRILLDESGSPESVIDLVKDPSRPNGIVAVDLDEPRIKIHLSPEDKKRIEAFRERGPTSVESATLFPAVYLHAVTEALRSLSFYSNETSWVRSIRLALEKENITADDETLKNNALDYGQILMRRPVERLLMAFAREEEE